MIKFSTCILGLGLLLIFSHPSFGQQNKAIAESNTLLRNNTWNSIYNTSALKVDYLLAVCPNPSLGVDRENVLLKFINPINTEVTIEFDVELYYNNKCYGCNDQSGEFHKSIILKPSASLEGSCANKDQKELYLFSKWVGMDNKEELTDFKITNIKVSPINTTTK